MKPLRLAFARIAQETNALSPLRTELSDFERTHYLEGEALLACCGRREHEAKGFLKNAELSGFCRAIEASDRPIELVPLVSAWAIPAGMLSRQCFETLRDRLVALVDQAGAIDGIFLCTHGAMRSEGSFDPDAELLEALRARLGERIPIVASVDLHAVMTRRKVAAADAIVAYRTNPHRDHARVGRRCGELLIRIASGDCKPVTAWRSLPMLLGGGTTLEFLPPMRRVFARMKSMEEDPRVLSVSALMSQPWHDHPDLGWAAHVVTDDDPDLAETLADELAAMLWATKDVPPPRFDSVADGVTKARRSGLRRRLGAVFFCDTSDVVTAGGTGENTQIIAELLEHAQGLTTLVALRDEVAVEALDAHQLGQTVTINVGGRISPELNPALPLRGQLHHRATTHGFGRAVVLRCGTVFVCITEASPAVMKPAFYQDLGLSVLRADIVVVKNLFPWRLFCALYNRRAVNIQTRGITDLDAAKVIEFADPMHPMVPVDDWRAADRRRRGL